MTVTTDPGMSSEEQLDRYRKSMEMLEGIQSNYARLVDQLMADLEAEKATTERLLRNILPEPIIERLRAGETVIADRSDDVTVVFCDLVDFTGIAATLEPSELVASLNSIFSAFDALCADLEVEKIKTIGDAYLAAAGLPVAKRDSLEAAAELALGMRQAVAAATAATGHGWQIRVGLHSGPVVAGIIGSFKYAYDVWGDTVNIASRLQTSANPGEIRMTQDAALRLLPQFEVRRRGDVNLKGIGTTDTWLLVGRALSPTPA